MGKVDFLFRLVVKHSCFDAGMNLVNDCVCDRGLNLSTAEEGMKAVRLDVPTLPSRSNRETANLSSSADGVFLPCLRCAILKITVRMHHELILALLIECSVPAAFHVDRVTRSSPAFGN